MPVMVHKIRTSVGRDWIEITINNCRDLIAAFLEILLPKDQSLGGGREQN